MSRTAIGVFDPVEAERVLDDLVKSGFGTDGISVLSHDEPTQTESEAELPSASEGLFGAYADYLSDLRGTNLRDIGAAVLAGPIAERVEQNEDTEADALLAALIEEGVPAPMAAAYRDSVRRGGALVAIRVADEDLPSALDVLKRHHERATMQRRSRGRGSSAEPPREEMESESAESTGDMSSTTETEVADRTELEQIEEAGAEGELTADYEAEEDVFRRHFQETEPTGGTFEEYSPAYRYGYTLGQRGAERSDWSTIEADAQRDWEASHPNTWEKFKAAIRHAWERATDKLP